MNKGLAKYDNAVLSAIADLYIFMHLLNLETYEQYTISDEAGVNTARDMQQPLTEQIAQVINALCIPEHQQGLLQFTDMRTLVERLGEEHSISFEFKGRSRGWCVARFIVVERNRKGQARKVIFTVLDIDAEKNREEKLKNDLAHALANQNEIYSEMLQLQGGGFLATTSVDGEILNINEAALNLLGLDANAKVSSVGDIFQQSSITFEEGTREKLLEIEKMEGRLTYEFCVHGKGDFRYVKADSKKITTQNGMSCIITTMSDITSNKLNEKALRALSDTDSMTGIPNRSCGERKMTEMLKNNIPGMFCLFDVDHFKLINDNFGHHIGDKVIIEIARALKNTLRSGDLYWRLGGDEFAFFVVGADNYYDAKSCLERFFREIGRINIPEIHGRKINITIGSVLVDDSVTDYYELYKNADQCMYAGKNVQGNSCNFYNLEKNIVK